jgi:predicted RNase H-like nuclease (RuvC/YqgF family)
MEDVKARLVEATAELVVAKRTLKSMKRERKAKTGLAEKNTDQEIETLEKGIKATKKEVEALAIQIADALPETSS